MKNEFHRQICFLKPKQTHWYTIPRFQDKHKALVDHETLLSNCKTRIQKTRTNEASHSLQRASKLSLLQLYLIGQWKKECERKFRLVEISRVTCPCRDSQLIQQSQKLIHNLTILRSKIHMQRPWQCTSTKLYCESGWMFSYTGRGKKFFLLNYSLLSKTKAWSFAWREKSILKGRVKSVTESFQFLMQGMSQQQWIWCFSTNLLNTFIGKARVMFFIYII